jgi:aspartyl-tRNA(Asn)/glutamyl-tRNA(Gln) amidotransferase subunit B
MEEGAFRCDANISIRATDDSFIGPKVEIKNMNSFRAVERALRYEEVRQREAAANGEDLFQETRGWIDASGTTVSQRTKEQAHDYRYFPEPDLPSLRMKPADLDRLRQALPELPASRRRRFIDDLGLPESDAAVLTNERAIADVYEDVIAGKDAGFARSAANWIVNDVLGLARSGGLPQDQLPLNAAQLRNLVESVEDGKLTVRVAKDVLPQVEGQELPLRVAERLNLLSMDDDDSVTKAAQEAIDANPDAVADYLGGKKAAVGRLIGETMKRTGGRAKPDAVRGALIAILDELEA